MNGVLRLDCLDERVKAAEAKRMAEEEAKKIRKFLPVYT